MSRPQQIINAFLSLVFFFILLFSPLLLNHYCAIEYTTKNNNSPLCFFFFPFFAPPMTIDNRQSLINDDTSHTHWALLCVIGSYSSSSIVTVGSRRALVYCAIFPLIKCQTELKHKHPRWSSKRDGVAAARRSIKKKTTTMSSIHGPPSGGGGLFFVVVLFKNSPPRYVRGVWK